MPNGKRNCPFCDSAGHSAERCNSNMKLKYKESFGIMISKECPDFQSFNMKFLKLIAFHTPYDNNITCTLLHKEHNKQYGNVFINKPIPLTLSKNRTVKALIERWTVLHSCRDKYNHGIDNHEEYEDDCPICYETMTNKHWTNLESKWVMDYNQGIIRTPCDHKFCNSCWNKVRSISRNNSKTCPMCRSTVSYDSIRTHE